jgi:hypothetical protein
MQNFLDLHLTVGLILPMQYTCIDVQLPHTGEHHEPTVRSSPEKLSAGGNVLTIPETGCLPYAPTAIINPNTPGILVKGHASPDIA